MKNKRAVCKYFGGKAKIAPWIVSFFPSHRVYVEPFGGAASVLMAKPSCSGGEIYNDLNTDIVNLFRVLRDPEGAAKLERLLRLTPYSRIEYDLAHEIIENDPVEQARRTIIRSLMGYCAGSTIPSNYKSGFRLDCNRKYITPAQFWAKYPDTLSFFCQRLQGVVIECVDAFSLIDKFKGYSDYLWYLDPPYVMSTRRQKHHKYFRELTDSDHKRLLSTIKDIKGAVVISGYDSEIYDDLGWTKYTKHTHTNNAGVRQECIWCNNKCEAERNKTIY